MEISRKPQFGPTSLWNPILHVKIDINQCTLPVPNSYLSTTRAVLFQRYFVCANYDPKFKIQWIDYNGEKPPKEIKVEEKYNDIFKIQKILPKQLAKTRILINNDRGRMITITLFYKIDGTGTLEVQGNKCIEWRNEEFNKLVSVIISMVNTGCCPSQQQLPSPPPPPSALSSIKQSLRNYTKTANRECATPTPMSSSMILAPKSKKILFKTSFDTSPIQTVSNITLTSPIIIVSPKAMNSSSPIFSLTPDNINSIDEVLTSTTAKVQNVFVGSNMTISPIEKSAIKETCESLLNEDSSDNVNFNQKATSNIKEILPIEKSAIKETCESLLNEDSSDNVNFNQKAISNIKENDTDTEQVNFHEKDRSHSSSPVSSSPSSPTPGRPCPLRQRKWARPLTAHRIRKAMKTGNQIISRLSTACYKNTTNIRSQQCIIRKQIENGAKPIFDELRDELCDLKGRMTKLEKENKSLKDKITDMKLTLAARTKNIIPEPNISKEVHNKRQDNFHLTQSKQPLLQQNSYNEINVPQKQSDKNESDNNKKQNGIIDFENEDKQNGKNVSIQVSKRQNKENDMDSVTKQNRRNDKENEEKQNTENRLNQDTSDKQINDENISNLYRMKIPNYASHVIIGDSVTKNICTKDVFNNDYVKMSVPGMTLNDLQNWMQNQQSHSKVKNVILHVGVNSCKHKNRPISKMEWKTLIETAFHTFPNAEIKLSSIIPPQISSRLSEFIMQSNENLFEICNKLYIQCIDHSSDFITERGYARNALYRDNLHPNNRGSRQITKNLSKTSCSNHQRNNHHHQQQYQQHDQQHHQQQYQQHYQQHHQQHYQQQYQQNGRHHQQHRQQQSLKKEQNCYVTQRQRPPLLSTPHDLLQFSNPEDFPPLLNPHKNPSASLYPQNESSSSNLLQVNPHHKVDNISQDSLKHDIPHQIHPPSSNSYPPSTLKSDPHKPFVSLNNQLPPQSVETTSNDLNSTPQSVPISHPHHSFYPIPHTLHNNWGIPVHVPNPFFHSKLPHAQSIHFANQLMHLPHLPKPPPFYPQMRQMGWNKQNCLHLHSNDNSQGQVTHSAPFNENIEPTIYNQEF